ncbi:MAG: hypothetical protein WDO06_00640 [Actinomycetota bacterium]
MEQSNHSCTVGAFGLVHKVEALNRGADDYVTKPFNIEEFFARIQAVSRRIEGSIDQPIVKVGDWSIDLARKIITNEFNASEKV